MQIDLSSPERLLLLDALRQKPYKEKMRLPKTKYAIRQTYRALIEKLEEDEILSRKVRETMPEKKIIIPGKDN
jgi:hypothetical protein